MGYVDSVIYVCPSFLDDFKGYTSIKHKTYQDLCPTSFLYSSTGRKTPTYLATKYCSVSYIFYPLYPPHTPNSRSKPSCPTPIRSPQAYSRIQLSRPPRTLSLPFPVLWPSMKQQKPMRYESSMTPRHYALVQDMATRSIRKAQYRQDPEKRER
jgi:hypothetical protein